MNFTKSAHRDLTRVNPSLVLTCVRLHFQYGAGNCKKVYYGSQKNEVSRSISFAGRSVKECLLKLIWLTSYTLIDLLIDLLDKRLILHANMVELGGQLSRRPKLYKSFPYVVVKVTCGIASFHIQKMK